MDEYQKRWQIVEWLKEYKAFKAGIKNFEELKSDLFEEGAGIDYSREPVSPTYRFNSEVENKVVRVDKIRIKRCIKTMQNVVHAIDKGLEGLNDIEREVIIGRCVEGKYYYEFCYKIHVSERSAKRIKKRALEKMAIVIFGGEKA